MRFELKGETPFQVMVTSFAVSPSNEGYTLHYSADGISYTPWDEPTPPDEVLVVNGHPEGMFFKLVGNESELVVQG